MIINDLDGYYTVFDTKNWNTELDTLVIYQSMGLSPKMPSCIVMTMKQRIILAQSNKRMKETCPSDETERIITTNIVIIKIK